MIVKISEAMYTTDVRKEKAGYECRILRNGKVVMRDKAASQMYINEVFKRMLKMLIME